GAPSGMLLGRLLLDGFRAIGVASPVLRVHYGLGALLLAGATALVVGQVAAWFAARAALRIRPAEVLAGQAAVPVARGRRRAGRIAGVLLLASAGVLQALGMAGLVPTALRGSYGMIASGLVIVGLGLLGSWAIHAAARAARPPLSRLAPVAGHLAAANVGFHHRRHAGRRCRSRWAPPSPAGPWPGSRSSRWAAPRTSPSASPPTRCCAPPSSATPTPAWANRSGNGWRRRPGSPRRSACGSCGRTPPRPARAGRAGAGRRR